MTDADDIIDSQMSKMMERIEEIARASARAETMARELSNILAKHTGSENGMVEVPVDTYLRITTLSQNMQRELKF